jgi:hypothetical protein
MHMHKNVDVPQKIEVERLKSNSSFIFAQAQVFGGGTRDALS